MPCATSCFQSSFPLVRSKHIAWSVSLAASTPDRNTRSCRMMGVEPAAPGKSALQATFSVGLQSEGRFFSSLEPLKEGPRHCGQSPASAANLPWAHWAANNTRANKAPCFIADNLMTDISLQEVNPGGQFPSPATTYPSTADPGHAFQAIEFTQTCCRVKRQTIPWVCQDCTAAHLPFGQPLSPNIGQNPGHAKQHAKGPKKYRRDDARYRVPGAERLHRLRV